MERCGHGRGALLNQRGWRADVPILHRTMNPERRQHDNVYEVTVRASDANLASTLDVEITVTDVNESGIVTGLSSIEYAENATTIVATYSVTDPESDDLTWNIAGTDAARFSISTLDGELTRSDRHRTMKRRTMPTRTTCMR